MRTRADYPLLAALALSLGCSAAAPCPRVDPAACDAPPTGRAEDVVDVDSFRRVASELICERALRCGDDVGIEFCHPGWAAYDAPRCDGSLVSLCGHEVFALAGPRSCVERLSRVRSCSLSSSIVLECQVVNWGWWSTSAWVDGPWTVAGSPCSSRCDDGLTCIAGACVPLGAPGEPCDRVPCESGLVCRDGACDFARAGERCADPDCGPGLVCTTSSDGRSLCAADRCPAGLAAHHVGCACASDAECPRGVSACVAGACVLRPLPSDACTSGGPTCVESTCREGRCQPS